MTTVDIESNPVGWRFDASKYVTVNDVLAALRANGFFTEANFLAEQITCLKAQIKHLDMERAK